MTSCWVQAASALSSRASWFERHGDAIVIDQAASVEMSWTTAIGGGPGNQLVLDPS
jgi:hypothetical protein